MSICIPLCIGIAWTTGAPRTMTGKKSGSNYMLYMP